jgi:cysteinyl-tRNA synthetase
MSVPKKQAVASAFRTTFHREGRRIFGLSPDAILICITAFYLPVSVLSRIHAVLRIYNTLSRQKEVFQALHPPQVTMYVCGMTVYDFCHAGHARSMVAFDVVQRWLRVSGYQVRYARNITDIDDKIIKRAVENGESIHSLTARFITALHEDADALGIERPDVEPRATDYVPQMLKLISTLKDKGLAYQASDSAQPEAGDVYLAVRKFPGYGKLSGKTLDELRAGERVAVDGGKQDPLDAVLWKSAKDTEPDEVKWPSAFGAGRPGWHIECSAMAQAILGDSIDIHGGGADLQHPHHENEIAQSEGANGCILAKTWMHNGFVVVDNEKMSKSLGNFFTIREVLEQFDAEVVRLFILRSHYRSQLNYSDVHLEDARASLLRLYTAIAEAPDTSVANQAIDWTQADAAKFKEAMDDDFNTPIAVSVLYELAGTANRLEGDAKRQALQLLCALASVLGLLRKPAQLARQSGLLGPKRQASVPSVLDEAAIEALVNERVAAKKARDFAKSDAIRASLVEAGIVVEDSATGSTWRRA